MNNKLIKLSKKKGFETKYPELEDNYLWMCELHKWLMNIHHIHIDPIYAGDNKHYVRINFLNGNNKEDFLIIKGNQNYHKVFYGYGKALEGGLFEALKLIKDESDIESEFVQD